MASQSGALPGQAPNLHGCLLIPQALLWVLAVQADIGLPARWGGTLRGRRAWEGVPLWSHEWPSRGAGIAASYHGATGGSDFDKSTSSLPSRPQENDFLWPGP